MRRVSHSGQTVAARPYIPLTTSVKIMLITLKIGTFLALIGGSVAAGFVWGSLL